MASIFKGVYYLISKEDIFILKSIKLKVPKTSRIFRPKVNESECEYFLKTVTKNAKKCVFLIMHFLL